METLTDFFAIAGWSYAGVLVSEFCPTKHKLMFNAVGAMAGGLIAASLVLG